MSADVTEWNLEFDTALDDETLQAEAVLEAETRKMLRRVTIAQRTVLFIIVVTWAWLLVRLQFPLCFGLLVLGIVMPLAWVGTGLLMALLAARGNQKLISAARVQAMPRPAGVKHVFLKSKPEGLSLTAGDHEVMLLWVDITACTGGPTEGIYISTRHAKTYRVPTAAFSHPLMTIEFLEFLNQRRKG